MRTILILLLFLLSSPLAQQPMSRTQEEPVRVTLKPVYRVYEKGVVSYYHYDHKKKLASGEHYSTKELCAAHKTLPFDTIVEVKRIDTGSTVTVRINDRGPFIKGRVIDLNRTAAKELGLVRRKGIARCEIRIIQEPDEKENKV